MAVEDVDSLQSRAMLGLLDLIGEGQIGGLVANAQSIFLDDTPLQNSDGSFNFVGVANSSFDFRSGTQTQSAMAGFSDVESPVAVGVQVKKATPQTITITNPNADSVRTIVTIPALEVVDANSGDVHGTSVQFMFEVATNGQAFVPLILGTSLISGGAIGLSAGYQAITAAGGAVGCGVTVTLDTSGVAGVVTRGNNDTTYIAHKGTATVVPQVWDGVSWVTLSDSTFYLGGDSVTPSDPYYWNVSFNGLPPLSAYFAAPDKTQIRFLAYLSNGAAIVLSLPKSNFPVSTITVTGKTRSKYQRNFLAKLPKTVIVVGVPTVATTWNIRMTRVTADSTLSTLLNETWFDSYSVITNSRLSYPNSAVAALRFDSSRFSQIPARSYLVNGLLIKVPANYDPVTRIYATSGVGTSNGGWDGTFKLAVSSCPPWVLYDLMTSKRYGLGDSLTASQINAPALYTIAQYCDGINARPTNANNDYGLNGKHGVPDGFGGFEPRFTVNTQITSQADAYKLISDLSSVFRGMSYWGGGLVGFMQDSPTTPTMIYSQANVVDGLFSYTGTARKDRHSVALITWNDPSNKYKQAIEYVEDSSLVAQLGIKQIEMVAFGCTSRGQAHRAGRWILYTEQYETDFITFKVGTDSALVLSGDVIRIHDTMRAGKRMGGRLVSCTATVATLDAPVTLVSAGAVISLRLPDGSFVDRTVLEGVGSQSSLSWVSVLPSVPVANSMFIVAETSLQPMLARVMGLTEEKGKPEYTIVAVAHNPSKYLAIENNLTLIAPKISILSGIPNAPTGLVVVDAIYRSGPSIATKLLVSWSDTQLGLRGWKVRIRNASGNWIDHDNLTTTHFEIPDVTDGEIYSIQVYAISLLGVSSPLAAVSNYTVLGKNVPPSNVVAAYAAFNDRGVVLSWLPVSDIDVSNYEARQGAWATGALVGTVLGDHMELGPLIAGTYSWNIRAFDTTGHYSDGDATASLTVNVPLTPVVLSQIVGADCVLSWTDCKNQQPVKSYEVRYGSTWATGISLGIVAAQTLKLAVSWTGARPFMVVARDTANNVGAAGLLSVTVAPPSSPVISSQFSSTNCVLSWSAPASTLPIVSYEVHEGGSAWGVGDTLMGVVNALTFSLTDNWTGVQTFRIAAKDSSGNVGAPGVLAVVINPPGIPTSFSAVVSGNQAVMTWVSPAGVTLPIVGYEVRIGPSWAGAIQTVPTIVSGTTHKTNINWIGTKTLWVCSIDSQGTEGTPASITLDVSVPAIPTVSSVISGTSVVISMSALAGTLPIDSYEVRLGSGTWAAATPVSVVKSNSLTLPLTWVGSNTYQVVTTDIAGNQSAPASTVATVSAPTVVSVSSSFLADQFTLTWISSTATLPIDSYEVRYGSTWSGGVSLGKTAGTSLSLSAQWVGLRRWWVAAYDVNGNIGIPASADVTINVASQPVITQQVVDNNVLLYWTQVQGTLPTTTYEVRRGATWATATLIGTKSGGFTTVFETVAGTFVYWVRAIDSAGNYGAPGSTTSSVSQPPDYVLKADFNTTFAGTKVGMALNSDGGYLMPVDTTETFSAHFTANSWTSPGDQIRAGFPLFIEPASASAYYEEVIDYGAAISSSKVTVTPNSFVVAGAPIVKCTISLSLDNITWTAYVGQWLVYGSNFRYVKYRIDVSSTGAKTDIYEVYGINVRMDSKLKNDAGMTNAGATDTVTGSTAIINDVSTALANNTPGASNASFTGGIASNVLTVTGTPTGLLQVGQMIRAGAGVSNTTGQGCVRISSLGTGTGGAGTYNLTASTSAVTAGSAMTSGMWVPDGAGTLVLFNSPVLDASSVQVSLSVGGTAKYALYDFVDLPNPTGMKVLLYDGTGTRVAGSFSWGLKYY
jgi:predicted phage tail protein